MILTCPECGTSYFVDDARIPAGGRSVKCSSCDARWTATQDAPSKPPPAAPKPAPPPVSFAADDPFVGDLEVVDPSEVKFAPPPPVRAVKAKAKAVGGGKVVVWIGAALAVAVVLAGAIIFRGAVVKTFPDAASAYAGVGLPVAGLGLVLEDVKAAPTFEGGRPALTVSGAIRNPQAKSVTSPPLRISLLDRTGKPVAAKVVRPLDAAIPARGTRYFTVTVTDPPASVHDLEVIFEPPAAKPAPGAVRAAPAAAPAATPAAAHTAPAAPSTDEAKPLPAGSPDALPNHG